MSTVKTRGAKGAREPREPKLGVLGGMGPQATQVFYQYVLDRTEASCDQEHLPALILSDTGVPDRTASILTGNTEPMYQRLLADARLLEECGCTVIAIPCNTSHYFVDRIQQEIGIPILHMIRETARDLGGPGEAPPRHPCHRRHHPHRPVSEGVRRLRPGGRPSGARCPASGHVHHLRGDQTGGAGQPGEICPDRPRSGLHGCDCAILGCTELSVFRSYHSLPPFYVDAMEVLAELAVVRCGKQLRTI